VKYPFLLRRKKKTEARKSEKISKRRSENEVSRKSLWGLRLRALVFFLAALDNGFWLLRVMNFSDF
jgi:hypothetical protein